MGNMKDSEAKKNFFNKSYTRLSIYPNFELIWPYLPKKQAKARDRTDSGKNSPEFVINLIPQYSAIPALVQVFRNVTDCRSEKICKLSPFLNGTHFILA